MAAFSSIIAGIGLAASAAGTAINVSGAQAQQKAQKRAVIAQAQQDQQRKKAMELETARKKREVIRSAQSARAQALAAATNQGAASDGSSALPGAIAGIEGQANDALLATQQNNELGVNMFDLKAQESAAQASAASAAGRSATGSGLASLGGALVNQSKTISSIFGRD